MANVKTNAVRILERADIRFNMLSYDWDGKNAPDGNSVAAMLGQDPGQVFKTLVARGASGDYYVFDIPVSGSHLKELFPLTRYVHGGCSPIGMKKQFSTVIDETCILYDTIFISAGKIGLQIELSPDDLITLISGSTADLVFEENS